jgi:uncharacterized protein YcnI
MSASLFFSSSVPTCSGPTGAARRTGAVLAATAVLLVAPVSAASAHVRVLPDNTAAGGYAELTFRVPNESETAGTTGLRIQLPTDTPFTAVRTQPVAGWTATVERSTLPRPIVIEGATITEAPTAVVWTAEPGVQIGPGEYQEFSVSVGRLPEEGTELLLPAAQTYSDGTVVDWDQAATNGEEPEHPAPTLTTTAAQGGHGGGDGGDGGEEAAVAVTRDDGDTLARWLGGAGLLAGAAALLVAVLRGRRPLPSRG